METTNPSSPWYPYVWVDPERMSGTPCFRNSRLPVKSLFDHLSHGYTVEGFMDAFDGAPRDMVLGVLEVAAKEFERSIAVTNTIGVRAA